MKKLVYRLTYTTHLVYRETGVAVHKVVCGLQNIHKLACGSYFKIQHQQNRILILSPVFQFQDTGRRIEIFPALSIKQYMASSGGRN